LAEFGIECSVEVVSAHRMPEDMVAWGRGAAERGLRVVIAGAGGAAHLPGMLASLTPLPVIGVPVPLKHLDGMDSLLSIVQMPAGVPVATVSIGGARNAGLLAARILAAGGDAEAERLRERMVAFQAELREIALAKVERLRGQRWATRGVAPGVTGRGAPAAGPLLRQLGAGGGVGAALDEVVVGVGDLVDVAVGDQHALVDPQRPRAHRPHRG